MDANMMLMHFARKWGWVESEVSDIKQILDVAIDAERNRCAKIAQDVEDDGSAADLSRFYAGVIANRILNGK